MHTNTALLLWRYTQQRRSATLSQVVAAHMQLDIHLFMHMKYCAGIDSNSRSDIITKISKKYFFDDFLSADFWQNYESK